MDKSRYYRDLGITSASSLTSMRERYFSLANGFIQEYARVNLEYIKAKHSNSKDLPQIRNRLTRVRMMITKINTAYDVLEDESVIMPDEEFVERISNGNIYQLLGVTKDAPSSAIQTRYVAMVSKLIPEIMSDSTNTDRTKKGIYLLRKLNTAFENLMDKDLRKKYNERNFSLSHELRPRMRTPGYTIVQMPIQQSGFTYRTSDNSNVQVDQIRELLCYKYKRDRSVKLLMVRESKGGFAREYPLIAECSDYDMNSTYFHTGIKRIISDEAILRDVLINRCGYIGRPTVTYLPFHLAEPDEELIYSISKMEEKSNNNLGFDKVKVVDIDRNGVSPTRFVKRGNIILSGDEFTMCEYSSVNAEGESIKDLIIIDNEDWEVLSGKDLDKKQELVDEKLTYSSIQRAIRNYRGYCGENDDFREYILNNGRRNDSWGR